MIKIIHYDSEGNIFVAEEYFYDNETGLVSEIKVDYLDLDTTFTYPQNQIKLYLHYGEKSNPYNITKIDKNYLIKNVYDNDSIYRYYDKNGNLLKKEMINFNGKIVETEKNYYEGDVLTKQKIDGKQSSIMSILDQFDPNDFPRSNEPAYEIDYSNEDKRPIKNDISTIVTYNNDGYLLSVSEDNVEKIKITRDKWNNPTEVFRSNTRYKCEYTYDKENNWIKRIISKGEIPIIMEERTIEYY